MGPAHAAVPDERGDDQAGGVVDGDGEPQADAGERGIDPHHIAGAAGATLHEIDRWATDGGIGATMKVIGALRA